ncbi:HeH/LEM domain-containing protein [Listeria ivanovii]|uniref:HeH/LEM domain-containing protein n=1 Tax=Listeria ivanovii TaxID=1638 RepID=UPI003CEB82C6
MTARAVSSDSAPISDYSNMTVAQLKEELAKRNIEYVSNAKKAELVALLEGSE